MSVLLCYKPEESPDQVWALEKTPPRVTQESAVPSPLLFQSLVPGSVWFPQLRLRYVTNKMFTLSWPSFAHLWEAANLSVLLRHLRVLLKPNKDGVGEGVSWCSCSPRSSVFQTEVLLHTHVPQGAPAGICYCPSTQKWPFRRAALNKSWRLSQLMSHNLSSGYVFGQGVKGLLTIAWP